MFGNQLPEPLKPGEIAFHPISTKEYRVQGIGMQQSLPISPRHETYQCGSCGASTNGRVLCEFVRSADKANVTWCLCSCEKQEPAVIIKKDDVVIKQVPLAKEFHAAQDWPPDLAKLYEEAALAYSAGAFTASSMACRKLLMACACDKSASDGLRFVEYVDYITNSVLTFPAAKASIDKIRDIGNDANHKIQFINQPDAARAMKIVTYLLNTIYSLPTA
jgi:hypothetical protein